ncbi:MAG: hypothetical protein GXP35_01750 [Actinobacteria bacterium]|nr:hypothetical protein [Actinomycetota bacterium]
MNESHDNESGSDPDNPDVGDLIAVTPTQPRRRTASASAPMLAGMMLAVGEIIEPEKTRVELHAEAAEPVDDDFDLDFGALPPLN